MTLAIVITALAVFLCGAPLGILAVLVAGIRIPPERIYGGTSEIMKAIITRNLTGLRARALTIPCGPRAVSRPRSSGRRRARGR